MAIAAEAATFALASAVHFTTGFAATRRGDPGTGDRGRPDRWEHANNARMTKFSRANGHPGFHGQAA